MYFEDWNRLTPGQQRLHRIAQAAYYMSGHRQLEGRQADPTEDWLNAEWRQDNLGLYSILERSVFEQIAECYKPARAHIYPGFKLPSDSGRQNMLIRFIETELKNQGWQVNAQALVLQSTTAIRLVDALITQVRCGGQKR